MNPEQLQEIYNSNMGKYCKPGEKKGMQLAEFLQIMYGILVNAVLPMSWLANRWALLYAYREKYLVYNDQFHVRDVKDPFLACKLVVLDEMATVGHKKLYITDFMELLLRISALRYPAKPLTVVEVATGLQKLFLNHFYKHEELLDQFRETVDQAMVQDRVEAFASAINSQNRKTSDSTGKRGGGSRKHVSLRKKSQSLVEHEDEGEDAEASSDDEDEAEQSVSRPSSSFATAELGTVVREDTEPDEKNAQMESSRSTEDTEKAAVDEAGGLTLNEPETQGAALLAG